MGYTRVSTGALSFILELKVWGCSWGRGARGGRVSAELMRACGGAYAPRCPGRLSALPSPAGPLIIFCEMLHVGNETTSVQRRWEDGERKEKKKTKQNQKPLKAFYLPIKMSQAVNAQTSLPFVGLATYATVKCTGIKH